MIKTSNKTELNFTREKDNLELLRCIKHPNIVELFCSYTFMGDHFLLFPAEPMDLHKFFKQPQPLDSFSKELTFYTSLQGLASALNSIHNFTLNKTEHLVDFSRMGSHRDIRPQNVLVNSDTFLFADLGLSDFKDPLGDRGSQTLWKAGRGDYIAPECYGEVFQRQKVGRAVDIWAFGCMILDIATYMKMGADGLQNFQTKRNGPWRPPTPIKNGYFFQLDYLKPEVLEHLNMLQAQWSEPAYRKLLNMSRSMLMMAPGERLTSQQTLKVLDCICTVFMFDDLQSTLERYNNFLTSQAKNGPSQATLWFEMERLNSWAFVLELHEEGLLPHTFSEASIDSKTSQVLLSGLRGIVDNQHQQMVREAKLQTEVKQSWILHSQFQKEFTESVQNLFDLLPLRLQKRADVAWTHHLLETSGADKLKIFVGESQRSGNESFQLLGIRANVKRNLETSLENPEAGVEIKDFSLDPAKLTNTHDSGSHTFGHYAQDHQKLHVLIESAFLNAERATGPCMGIEEMQIRRLALAMLFATPEKPADFRVLQCIGFIDRAVKLGTGKVDYIFKLPDSSQHPELGDYTFNDDPQSLHQALESPALRDPHVPPLEQRFGLANILVSSIHSLHLNGWLHKSLSADNVLLFKDPAGKLDLLQARIIGFKESRPDGEIWTSSGPDVHPYLNEYIHPEYRRILSLDSPKDCYEVRYRRVYDYFSLGVLLLEIGLWRSLRDMSRKHRSTLTESFKDELESKYMPRLRSLMGSAYTKIVDKCLKTDFIPEKPGSGAEVQLRDFYINVVEPMVELHVR